MWVMGVGGVVPRTQFSTIWLSKGPIPRAGIEATIPAFGIKKLDRRSEKYCHFWTFIQLLVYLEQYKQNYGVWIGK